MNPAEVPGPLGRRGSIALGLLILAALAWIGLGLQWRELWPSAEGLHLARKFGLSALRPALDHQSEPPVGSTPFATHVGTVWLRTLGYAIASMALALPAGLLLGALATPGLWPSRSLARMASALGPASAGYGAWLALATRGAIALMRSVHELLWAVLFMAAMGISSTAAIVALSIPQVGTLAKVFAEQFEECPPQSASALRGLGAGSLLSFLFGIVPRVAADMTAYSFYRFECALRSSAVLGFFGYATLGHDLKLAFESLRYREVWTYIYVLIATILLLEAWSSSLRKRMTR